MLLLPPSSKGIAIKMLLLNHKVKGPAPLLSHGPGAIGTYVRGECDRLFDVMIQSLRQISTYTLPEKPQDSERDSA